MVARCEEERLLLRAYRETVAAGYTFPVVCLLGAAQGCLEGVQRRIGGGQ